MHYNKPNPSLALFLCAFLWSTGGILIKFTEWNAFAIAGGRSIIGAATMILVLRRFPVILSKKADGTIDKKQSIDKLVATLTYSATMILFVFANKYTTAANAILLQYTNVLYVIALGPLFLGEKNEWIDYVAGFGILGGMALLVSDGFSAASIDSTSLLGIVLALISGLMFAFSTIFLRRQKDGNPEDSFTLSNIVTFLVALPFMFSAGVPSLQSVGGLFLLGIFQIGIPAIFYSMGITRVTAISAVLITMLEPVMNPIWVFLFYREIPSRNTILGGITILGFLFFRSYIKSRSLKKVR